MKRQGHVTASKLLMSGVLCLATVGAARTASAEVQVRSPFPDSTPVIAIVGYSPDNGGNYVFWNNFSTGECRVSPLGGASLSQSAIVYAAANAGSHVNIVSTVDGSVTTCQGVTVLPLRYGGYYLDIVGGAGNDTLRSRGTGDTFIWGQGGNDTIQAARPGAMVTGGAGDDSVLAENNTPTSYYDLGDGNDCLDMGFISSPPPSNRVLCGAGGSDKIARGNSSTGQACELFPTSCP